MFHHQLPFSQMRSTLRAGNSTCKISSGNTPRELCKLAGLVQLGPCVIYHKKSRVRFLWNVVTALSLEVAKNFSAITAVCTTSGINGACRVCYPEPAGCKQTSCWAGWMQRRTEVLTIPKPETLRHIKCIHLHPQGRIVPFLEAVKILSAIARFVSMILCFQCRVQYILSVIKVNLNGCLT